MLLQSLDSLLPRHARLSHNQFDILRLNACIIHLNAIIFLLFFLRVGAFDGFAFFCMVVASMGITRSGLV